MRTEGRWVEAQRDVAGMREANAKQKSEIQSKTPG